MNCVGTIGIKIIQWNIRGVFNNLENLCHFLFHNKPEILLLNETLFKPNDLFCLKYTIYRSDRADGLR